MNDILKEAVGKTIEVRSGDGSYRDDGKLLDLDERWVKIAKDSGEVLYFSIFNVRLIKPIEWEHEQRHYSHGGAVSLAGQEILQEIVGRTIEVRSGDGSYRDDGKLVAYDERWIKVEKGSGESLYFPIFNIRLVKPLN